ncbi:MAG: S41 family peptidase [Myxococcota bacterium]
MGNGSSVVGSVFRIYQIATAMLVLLAACGDDGSSPSVDAMVADADFGDADGSLRDATPDADLPPEERPSASFLIDPEASEKAYWPGHPLTECILLLANTSAEAELVDLGLSLEAAAAIVSLRGDGFSELDQLDEVPHTGHRAIEALTSHAESIAECRCEGAACGTDPRPAQRTELNDTITFLIESQGNAIDLGVDDAALRQQVDAILARGAGTPVAFAYALRAVALTFPNGHAGIFEQTGRFPFAALSPWQVCARPHPEGFVLTYTADDNPLGLSVGEMILAVDGRRGNELIQWLTEQPASSTTPPSESGIAHVASQMLFATLRPGATLTIRTHDGTERERFVDQPTPTDPGTFCRDAFARDLTEDVYVTTRGDGVVVLRLPNLIPEGEPTPTTDVEVLAYMQVLVDRIRTAFADVRADATGVIWDLRANAGGISPVGFSIVQGFQSTRAGDLSNCEARIRGTENFIPGGGDYSIAPGGTVTFDGRTLEVGDAFEVDVPTAVIVDGLAVSAADYFALATRRQSDALLVGAPTVGGYGASTLNRPIGDWSLVSDSLRCVDRDGIPLEGYGVEVDLAVDYDPADLAAGRDTVLEEAAAALLRCGGNDCAPPD